MKSTTRIALDLQRPNIAVIAYAVQNDRDSRYIEAQIVDGGTAWPLPAGASALIRFRKPDNTAGAYDTLEDNVTPAVTWSGSVATLTMAEQVLTVPGDVCMELNFYSADGERLTTFSWTLRVRPSVLTDAEIISTDYYNILTAQIASGIQAAENAAASAEAAQESAAAAAATLAAAVQYTPQTGKTDAEKAAARENLGLGSVATESVVPVSKGGTDATAADAALANLGGVSKSGDTMTGNLLAQDANFGTITTSVTSGTAPDSNTFGRAFYLYDGASFNIGTWQLASLANGQEGFQLAAAHKTTSGNKFNYLRILVDAEGNAIVALSDPAAWRTALSVPQIIKFTNMNGLTASDLLAALTANNASIPVGVSLLQMGSSTNPQIALVLCVKNSATLGRGQVISSYGINGTTVTLGSGGWT